MTDEKIGRINELYNKAKNEGLTEEEKAKSEEYDDFSSRNICKTFKCSFSCIS